MSNSKERRNCPISNKRKSIDLKKYYANFNAMRIILEVVKTRIPRENFYLATTY